MGTAAAAAAAQQPRSGGGCNWQQQTDVRKTKLQTSVFELRGTGALVLVFNALAFVQPTAPVILVARRCVC